MPDGFIERMGLQAVLDLKEFRQNARIYDQSLKRLNQQTEKAAQQAQKSAASVGKSWEVGFAKVAAAAAAAAVAFLSVRKAVGFLQQATQLAARVETLGVSLAVVGKNAGYTTEQIAEYEEAVKESGITTRAARQSLLQMAQAKIDFAHAADLARIAQDAAVIADTDSSEATQRLTTIIQTGNILMGRRLGLQLDFQGSYERMAAQINKTTEELNDQDKTQARVNEVLRAGAGIAGTYTAAMETAGKMQNSLNRLFEETQLAIGRIQLGGFATGIDEITRLMKDLGKWLEENEEELEALGLSITQLVDAAVAFADLELPVEELTEFVDKLTTLASILAIGIEAVKNFRLENNLLSQSLDRTLTVLSALNKFAAWPITVMDVVIDKYTEMRKADEDLFKTEQQLAKEREALLKGRGEIIRDDLARMKAAAAEEAEQQRELDEIREKAAKKLQDGLDRIADTQRDYYLKLAEMEADANRRRSRDFNKFQSDFRKQSAKGQVALSKITATYEKRRAKAIVGYNKRVIEMEKGLGLNIAKAREDFALRQSQAQERLQLNRIQSERRFQFERGRLVAEGDTLAIEELDARHKLEQQEREENERLRKRQAQETQDAMVKAMEAAGRAQGQALAEALTEQLQELEEQKGEELGEQKQANIDRLVEMTQTYQEQQRLKDEDDALAKQKADANYQRQLEDLGRNLSDQEELQEFGAEQTERVLDQYYGEDGISDRIMEGWHERENTRILITAAMLEGMATGLTAIELGTLQAAGGAVGMDAGGIVTGPQTVQVGAGVTEAFIPLSGPGAGGAFTHEFTNALNITGLEGASQMDVNAIAKALAKSLTNKVRSRRRG